MPIPESVKVTFKGNMSSFHGFPRCSSCNSITNVKTIWW
jgi:aconitase B